MTDTKQIQNLISKLQAMMSRARSMPNDKAVKAIIAKSPGLQRAEIAKAVGMTPEQAGRALERLTRLGEVMCVGQRRAAHWYLWSQLEQATNG